MRASPRRDRERQSALPVPSLAHLLRMYVNLSEEDDNNPVSFVQHCFIHVMYPHLRLISFFLSQIFIPILQLLKKRLVSKPKVVLTDAALK